MLTDVEDIDLIRPPTTISVKVSSDTLTDVKRVDFVCLICVYVGVLDER